MFLAERWRETISRAGVSLLIALYQGLLTSNEWTAYRFGRFETARVQRN